MDPESSGCGGVPLVLVEKGRDRLEGGDTLAALHSRNLAKEMLEVRRNVGEPVAAQQQMKHSQIVGSFDVANSAERAKDFDCSPGLIEGGPKPGDTHRRPRDANGGPGGRVLTEHRGNRASAASRHDSDEDLAVLPGDRPTGQEIYVRCPLGSAKRRDLHHHDYLLRPKLDPDRLCLLHRVAVIETLAGQEIDEHAFAQASSCIFGDTSPDIDSASPEAV